MQTIYDCVTEPAETAPVPSAVVLGNFDGIHLGHRTLLQEADEVARSQGLCRRVVTFSPHPRQRMGQPNFRLIYNDQQKAELMEETGLVDQLILMRFDSQLQSMQPEAFFHSVLRERYQARAIVVGGNFHFGVGGRGDTALLQALCQEYGLQCRVAPHREAGGQPISSSRIRRLLEEGEMEEANRLLGRPYFVEGTVRRGKQLGRRMQTPTINLMMREERLAPKKGVYISRTYTDGGQFASISNVGHNPTVGGESLRTETHILEFSGNLYEQTVRVELLKFLRPEQRFESVEALHTQLMRDIANAKEYFQLL